MSRAALESGLSEVVAPCMDKLLPAACIQDQLKEQALQLHTGEVAKASSEVHIIIMVEGGQLVNETS